MFMKKITAIIGIASDGGYSVYCEDEMFAGMGDTLEAAKKDMEEAMFFFKDVCKEEGYSYPEWLDGEYEIEYKFDPSSVLKHYAKIIPPAALGRIAGINPKQMWNYTSGKSKPRKQQLAKIQEGLHKLAAELSGITLL